MKQWLAFISRKIFNFLEKKKMKQRQKASPNKLILVDTGSVNMLMIKGMEEAYEKGTMDALSQCRGIMTAYVNKVLKLDLKTEIKNQDLHPLPRPEIVNFCNEVVATEFNTDRCYMQTYRLKEWEGYLRFHLGEFFVTQKLLDFQKTSEEDKGFIHEMEGKMTAGVYELVKKNERKK